MWTYRHLVPILILIMLVEVFLATEHVLEEIIYEGVMHYEETVSVQLDWLPSWAFSVDACLPPAEADAKLEERGARRQELLLAHVAQARGQTIKYATWHKKRGGIKTSLPYINLLFRRG